MELWVGGFFCVAIEVVFGAVIRVVFRAVIRVVFRVAIFVLLFQKKRVPAREPP